MYTEAENNGLPCAFNGNSTAQCLFGEGQCVVPTDCVGEWGKCTHICDETFAVLTPLGGGGAACSAKDGAVRACSVGEGDCLVLPPPHIIAHMIAGYVSMAEFKGNLASDGEYNRGPCLLFQNTQ